MTRDDTLRRVYRALPPPLQRVARLALRTVVERRVPRLPPRPRFDGHALYAWWWWRGPNRPRINDRTYINALECIRDGVVGLDLGSRSRIRPDAVTVDVEPADGVDVVADGHDLPFPDDTFDYVWSNAVLEHVRNPFVVSAEIVRVLKPGGVAIVQVPFLESIHSWPTDYFRFTTNGLRELFKELDEVAVGVSAGPTQVLPDLLTYYGVGFSDIQSGRLLSSVLSAIVSAPLVPLRLLDRVLRTRPAFWRWARAYYYVGRKPPAASLDGPRVRFVMPSVRGGGFEEVMRLRAREAVRALKTAGASVEIAEIGTLRGVRDGVDLVSAPNMNYLLESASKPGTLPDGPTRFAMLWDDPLGALALRDLNRRGVPMGSTDGRPEPGALERFAKVMKDPRVVHFTWDSGHAAAATELGLVDPDAVEWYPIATYEPFLRRGEERTEFERDLSFCGNVYPHAIQQGVFANDPFYSALTDRICRAKESNLERPLWTVLRDEIGRLDGGEGVERGLMPTHSTFWDYYVYVVWLAATTRARLTTFGALDRTVDVFGVFADPDSVGLLDRNPNLVYRGNAHQFRELPSVFASTRINICLSNGLIHSGVPSKLVDCLASGGFALVDPKPDLVKLFGPVVERIFFRDGVELAERVAYFLERADERREIVDELRSTILRECTLERLFSRVLEAAPRRAAVP